MSTLWAATPEMEFAKALTGARSSAEVEHFQAQYSRFKIADTACRVELREHSAPVSCYEALALEKSPAGAKAVRIKHLDKLCSLAAEALRVENSSTFVSRDCAKSLAAAREIRKYREIDDADWSKY
jgi:hypothetical protein